MQRYYHSFISKLIGRVDEIVVLDPFAGSGLFSVGYQRELIPSSSFACLSYRLPVKRWILSEPDGNQFAALKVRVGRYFRDQPVLLQERTPRGMIDKLGMYLPAPSSGTKVALLTLVDPFDLVSFDYLERLKALGSSFIMAYTFPLSSRMDHAYYVNEAGPKLKSFLRNSDLPEGISGNDQFYKRLVQTHQRHILSVGLGVSTSFHKLESQLMNVNTFAVSFFSGKVEVKSVQQEYMAAASKQFDLFN